ncbi:MAG: CD225/dispanin family protein [Planctomycetota bacterium]|nr:CD225/dispanin family protein [Planctomycetota bacterium]
MKVCIHCSKEFEDDAPFCPYCGHAQEKSEHEPRIQPPPPKPPEPPEQKPESEPQEISSSEVDDIFEEAFGSSKSEPHKPKKREPTSSRHTRKFIGRNSKKNSDVSKLYSKRIFKSNIIAAILVTIFCCMPFGIIAVVFSVKAIGEKSKGNMVKAEKYASYSRNLTTIAVILGIISALIGLSGTCG